MTDHPLTDEICREVADSMINFPNGFPDAHDHMRAAADWQLEQVIEWLNEAIFEQSTCFDIASLPEELAKVMRPQEAHD